MKRTIVHSLCALPIVACSGLHLEGGVEVAPPEEPIEIVEGDPCEEIAAAAVSDGAVARDLAFGLGCGHPSRVSLSSVADGYTDGDSLYGVAWFVRCAEDDECLGSRAAELGFAHYLAGQADAARSEVELPEDLQAELDTRVDAAIQALTERVDALDPAQTETYVDIPSSVAREFDAARDQFAENYDLFETMAPIAAEELDAGTPSAPTHTELNSIRNSTVSECLHSSGLLLQECLDGPITRASTGLLLRFAVAREDWPRARVELEYLENGSDRSSFISAVIIRQAEATARMADRFEEAAEAREDGDSEEEIEARFGAVADLSSDSSLPWTPAPIPVNRGEVTENVRQVCGTVESTELEGDWVTVEFDRIRISPREFECVEGPYREVHWGERTIVMEDCEEFEDTVRLRPDPIQISRGDAQNIEEGNVIEAWIVQDRTGAISAVFSDDDATVPAFIGAFANP